MDLKSKITNIDDLKKATIKVKLPEVVKIKQQFANYCRACATEKVPLIDIYGEKGTQMKLHQKIEHLQKISQNDCLPTKLCMDCICDLRVSHSFFVQLNQAEQKLSSMCNSIRESIFEESTTETTVNNGEILPDKDIQETIEESKPVMKISPQVKVKPKNANLQKLDLENPINVRKQEDGVMYVTVKGSNPNELLLIKVKKMDKSTEKKTDKKLNLDPVQSIEKQIEQYEKKRIEVLGTNFKQDTANKNTDHVSENVTAFSKVINQNVQESDDSQNNTHQRPKKTLGTEDEGAIQDLQSHSKQRKVVVSKTTDDGIRLSLEQNKAACKSEVQATEIMMVDESGISKTENIEEVEDFECDFCFRSFWTRELEIEHSKTHEIQVIHACDDCNQVFPTNKMRRSHLAFCANRQVCRYCDEVLESRGKKRQHEQKHCDDLHGQLCDVCGEKLKNYGTLDQHVKSKHLDLDKSYQCPKCPKKFAFRTKLTFHVKSVHTTQRPFLCEDCGSDFKNPASLRHHRMRKHQTVNHKKVCPVCQKVVPSYSLSKHMHTHKDYTINCPHCDKKFKNSSTLKQHVRIHEDQRQYKCDTCGVGFNRRDGLKLHLRVHQKTDSRGLKECSCQVCGEKFPNHSTLVIHRNRTHKDGKVYTCFICNRSMVSPRSLEWHLSHIHNQTVPGIVQEEGEANEVLKRVACNHCDKTFKTELILRTHVKNTHTVKEPVKCTDCELTFTSEVRLKHHLMVEHDRLEGTLKCPHCPKRFVNRLRLKTHMIVHSDERPYTCDACGFTLKTKIQLIKHHQNRHSDERPLKCKFCPWRCKQVSALVCHERTHTNERPYSCSVCNQRFKYLGDKNKHERRHESLGGSGFKRIVTSRTLKNNNMNLKEENMSESDQEQQDMGNDSELMAQEFETLEEGHFVKYEEPATSENEAEAAYEQMYFEEINAQDMDGGPIIVGVQQDAIYTEEVTTDPEAITTDMTDQMLPPGTVLLQHEDEDGKIQMIPVVWSLSDLGDENGEVDLTNASIMYSN